VSTLTWWGVSAGSALCASGGIRRPSAQGWKWEKAIWLFNST